MDSCCDRPFPYDQEKWPNPNEVVLESTGAVGGVLHHGEGFTDFNRTKWHDHAHQHYNSSYQVCCNILEGVPSPVNEFNDMCCGVGPSAHYDGSKQTCCNSEQGVPSSRTHDWASADLRGDVCVHPTTNLTADMI
jgi:hypothetical protein